MHRRSEARGSIRWTLLLPLFPALGGLGAADCNLNGVEDAVEIASGASADCNLNGVPDSCEFAPLELGLVAPGISPAGKPQAALAADLDGDGASDIATAESVTGGEDRPHFSMR